MKFEGIEKEIDILLDNYIELDRQNKSHDMQLGFITKDDGVKAIVTALRKYGVNLNDFIMNAFEEWEYILNKMVDRLPRYIQENLNGYEIKEEIGE